MKIIRNILCFLGIHKVDKWEESDERVMIVTSENGDDWLMKETGKCTHCDKTVERIKYTD